MIGQLVPLTLGGQQALQLRGGAAVRGIDVHRLAQRPDRAVVAVQLLFVELRAPAQQRQLRRRFDGAPGLFVDQLAQLLPGAPALQRALEKLRDVAIVGARVEQTPVMLLRLGPLSQTEVEDLRGPADDVEDRGVLAQLALQVTREQAGQVLPAIQLVGQANQLLQAETLGRRLLEHLAVPAQRAVVVLQLLLVEAGDALGPRQPLGGLLDLDQANLADLDQRRPSARPAYTGSSSSAAGPCTAMSSSIPSSIVIAPG